MNRNQSLLQCLSPRSCYSFDMIQWRWRFGLRSMLIVLYLLSQIGTSASDWTNKCPTGCSCIWTGGKKSADCKDAGFSSIPSGLSDEVQVLDLKGNAITSLGKDVFKNAGLLNLNKIKMNHCGIQRVDRYAFSELKLLVELDLSDNSIRELTMESFETNARLREFQISGNPLTQLRGVGFPPLFHFQKLSLRNCNLSSIPSRAFEKLTALEQLDLSGNQFEFFSDEMLVHLRRLKAVALHDNPWRCDCRLKSFRDWVLNNNLLQARTTCATPALLANYEWNMLQNFHFACAPEITTLRVSGQTTDAYIVGDTGKDIRLECLVVANPPADVGWIKDSISMTNATASAQGKNYVVHISGENNRWINLTIRHSNTGDAGDYTCVGKNDGGSVEKNITLQFQDVPASAGVGLGVGNSTGETDRSWLWILIGCLASLLLLTTLLIFICFCARKRTHPKTTRDQDIKGLQQDEPFVSHETRNEGRANQDPTGSTPLLSPGSKYSTEVDPDYPDLLDLPHRPQESPPGSTASTLPDSTRLFPTQPQQLNPAALYDSGKPSMPFYTPQNHHPLLSHPHLLGRRPQSPYSGSVASFASEPPQAIVPPPNRPGYVTLPRRPRAPSWSPATRDPMSPRSVSPTGSAVTIGAHAPYVKYDNLGPRTTADGSSRLSLNKLDHGTSNGVPHPGHSATLPSNFSRTPAARAGATPLPHISPSTHFNFDPIQEVEGPTTPTKNQSFPPNYGLPMNPDTKPTPTPQPPTPSQKKVPPKPPPKPNKKGSGVDSPSPQPAKGDDGTEV